MKLRTAFALSVAALTIGVPVATADPDGYQPQLHSPPAVASSGAAAHPDSWAVRPGPTVDALVVTADGRDWTTTAVGVVGGAFIALLAVVGALAVRDRRRLVLASTATATAGQP
jgi:hypothetical protein